MRRNSRFSGKVTLNIVTGYRDKHSHILNRAPGWYWWYEAISPRGESLCGVTKGPFPTEAEAISDAEGVDA